MALISQSCPIPLSACLSLSGMWSDESVQFSNTLGRYHLTNPRVFFGFLGIPFCQYSSSLLLKALQPWANLVGKCHGWIRDTRGGYILSSLHAALYKRHFHVTNLLFTHGAVMDVQGADKNTPLHLVSEDGDVDIRWWLLDHGTNINVQAVFLQMPLYLAGFLMCLEAVQVLLEHNADINLQDSTGETPLLGALTTDQLVALLSFSFFLSYSFFEQAFCDFGSAITTMPCWHLATTS